MSMSSAPKSSSARSVIATLLMVIYLFIALAPLLSPALASQTVLHALTDTCTGDCDTCGCSAESRASHTCCCAKKKEIEAKAKHRDTAPECCRKAPGGTQVVIASCGCRCGLDPNEGVFGFSDNETLPFYFSASLAAPPPELRSPNTPPLTLSRDCEPPDPPPRLV